MQTSDYGPHLLGRLPLPRDDRDYNADTLRALYPWDFLRPMPKKKYWGIKKLLDQGKTNHCVGFAWAHFLMAEPVTKVYSESDAHNLYYLAKVQDGEVGQENGSTTRSGALATRARGRIKNFAFTYSVKSLERQIKFYSPCVIGIPWHEEMFTPNGEGFIRPLGDPQGGHEILVTGADTRNGQTIFQLANSWGREWGKMGFAYVTANDLQFLIREGGEACMSVELPLPQTIVRAIAQIKKVKR